MMSMFRLGDTLGNPQHARCTKEGLQVINPMNKVNILSKRSKLYRCDRGKKIKHGFYVEGFHNQLYSENFQDFETGVSQRKFGVERSYLPLLVKQQIFV